MYIDLIILLVVLVGVWFYNNKFQAYIIAIGTTDIILRILNFVKYNIGLKDIADIINKYLPGSIFEIIDKYTADSINILLKWAFVIIMIVFVSYMIKLFVKRRRI